MEFLSSLLPILYPSFYSLCTAKNEELIFLDNGDRLSSRVDKNGGVVADFISEDKTQCEATNNHFHLFDRVGEKGCPDAIQVGTAIAKNLLRNLLQVYPSKKFVVYLEVNEKDSTIVRFHQIWDNEPPYLDISQFNQPGLHLFEFRA
jgi:hypothetical protein